MVWRSNVCKCQHYITWPSSIFLVSSTRVENEVSVSPLMDQFKLDVEGESKSPLH